MNSAFAGAFVGRHVEQILALVEDLAAGHLVTGMARQRARQRALPGAVGPHDGVDFAPVDREVDAAEDLLVLGADFEISDFQHCHID